MLLQQKLRESAAKKEPVEMYHTISQLTLDVVLRCAFSFNSNCQREGSVTYFWRVNHFLFYSIQ